MEGIELIDKMEKQKKINLKRKLFVSHSHNHKIEKAFVRNLDKFNYGVNQSAAGCVTGGTGCSILIELML